MPNYQNGKIYSIRSHLTTDIYIGSTIETLSNRLSQHKKYYENWLNKKTNYTSSFKIIEKDDECYIELIELYPCNSRIELCRREGEIIRNTICVNKNIAGRTKKQYREEHKEILAEKEKIRYNNNKQQINERTKQYYENNKQIIAEKAKQMYENNKEIIVEKSKQYNQNNKQSIAEKSKQKYTCECGSTLTKYNKSKHEKTKKHQSFVNLN